MFLVEIENYSKLQVEDFMLLGAAMLLYTVQKITILEAVYFSKVFYDT
jgi:hypothetical protein